MTNSPTFYTTTTQVKRIYYFLHSLYNFSASLSLAVLVLYLRSRGFELGQIGLFFGIAAFSAVLLEVPTGGLADSIGRKRVTLIAQAVSILAHTVLLFAISLPIAIVYAVLMGVARALLSGSLDAWFVDALKTVDPKVNLQPFLAGADTIETSALLVGVLIGAFIPQYLADTVVSSSLLNPFAYAILAAVCMRVISWVFVLILVKETPRDTDAEASAARRLDRILGDAFKLIKDLPVLRALLLPAFVTGAALGTVDAFWQPHFSSYLGESADNSLLFGVIFAVAMAVATVGTIYVTRLVKQFGGRLNLVAGLGQAIKGLAIMALGLSTPFVPNIVIFSLIYLMIAFNLSPHGTLFNEAVPSQRRSVMLSVQSLIVTLGAGLGVFILGLVAEQSSLATVWFVLGGLTLISAFPYFRPSIFGLDKAIRARQS